MGKRKAEPRPVDPAAVAEETLERAKEALRRGERILEAVGDALVVTDPYGRITSCNQAARKLADDRRPVTAGSSCQAWLEISRNGKPLDCSKGCALLREAGSGYARDKEVTHRGPDGRDQQLLVTVTAVPDHNGNVQEVVHSYRDISELKRADEAKTNFLATASHELKTPLTVILGYTQLMLSDISDPQETQEALEAIESRARELARIVDRLLLTGRIDGGRVELGLKPVDISLLLPDRINTLAAATGRDISCTVAEDLPAILGDSEAFATVVDHLVDNAVKYSPGGEPIVVDAHEHNGTIVVDITDGGIGMNSAQVAHCFDQFWQAESSDVRRFGGTGVGLYIVKSLVEGMDGQVRVRGSLGSGSTFSVLLQSASGRRNGRTSGGYALEPASKRSRLGNFVRNLAPSKSGNS
jgi:signal transduction histidine kinase